MSPVYLLTEKAEARFPRVSGDEPERLAGRGLNNKFSPREWG